MRTLSVKETQKIERKSYVFCSENIFWSPGAEELATEKHQYTPRSETTSYKNWSYIFQNTYEYYIQVYEFHLINCQYLIECNQFQSFTDALDNIMIKQNC